MLFFSGQAQTVTHSYTTTTTLPEDTCSCDDMKAKIMKVKAALKKANDALAGHNEVSDATDALKEANDVLGGFCIKKDPSSSIKR